MNDQRSLDDIIADLDRNESKRDRLDKRYWKRSNELTEEHEKFIQELMEWKP